MYCFFFFNDTATTEIYTLSLHDALPISHHERLVWNTWADDDACPLSVADRKSTRLNSSHLVISYAVFCLKKKNHPSTSTQCVHPITLGASTESVVRQHSAEQRTRRCVPQ